MSLDLSLDDAQAAIADATARLCADRCGDDMLKAGDGSFPAELWRALAEQGVLSLLTPQGFGGAIELVAALESLGRAVFPGPLPATFLATQLLPEKERTLVVDGEVLVSVGTPPLLPFAPLAGVFVELDGARAWLARPAGAIEPVATLGGEPWGRLSLVRELELEGVERALTVYDTAAAAYLAACGARLVDDAAEHARTRKQFGRAIGEFQAVAHPLAECHLQLCAAATLARVAAFAFDQRAPDARARAAAARLSAGSAALDAAFVVHQVFGALGVTTDGPVFFASRRIQQLVGQPPGAEPSRAAVLAPLGL